MVPQLTSVQVAKRANTARNKKLSPKRRSEIAAHAANVRHAKNKEVLSLIRGMK